MKKSINETALAVIVLLIIGIFFAVFNKQEKLATQSYEMPVLNLPLRYFPYSDFRGGNYSVEEDIDDKDATLYAYMEQGYRSFPTTTISLSPDDYSLNKDVAVSRFSSDDTINLQEFDVDGDGKNETIAYTCSLGGNHCPHKIFILKNGKVIFSVSAGLTGLDLVKSETGNGFYVHWVPLEDGTKWDTGLCCPPGYISTRFVYENGKFKPVYEQEVLFFEVKNTDAVETIK